MTESQKILVLRTYKHGESDLIVHALNSRGARMNFIAKGGLKSRKRFAGGVLEPTHYIEATFKLGKAQDADPLHFLLEARLIKEFPKLRTNYDRLEAALYMLKLVHKLSQQGEIDSPETFNLLGNGLSTAETTADPEKLKLHFEIKLLAAQGVLPHEDEFQAWLQTSLGKHETITSDADQSRRVAVQIHDHLRQYLGQF